MGGRAALEWAAGIFDIKHQEYDLLAAHFLQELNDGVLGGSASPELVAYMRGRVDTCLNVGRYLRQMAALWPEEPGMDAVSIDVVT